MPFHIELSNEGLEEGDIVGVSNGRGIYTTIFRGCTKKGRRQFTSIFWLDEDRFHYCIDKPTSIQKHSLLEYPGLPRLILLSPKNMKPEMWVKAIKRREELAKKGIIKQGPYNN